MHASRRKELSFYTSAEVYGSNILLREIDENGIRSKRKEQYRPDVYLVDGAGESEYRGLHGESLRKINPGSIRDTREFIKQFRGADNFEIFGQLNFTLQFLGQYKMTDWKREKIRCFSIDIETRLGEDANGNQIFPDPLKADAEIVLISMHDMQSDRTFTFGTKEYTGEDRSFNYLNGGDERNMLKLFLNFWEQVQPDVITGWHTEGFDIPFIINRIEKILGSESLKRLSPWGIVEHGVEQYKGEAQFKYKIYGVSSLDYLDLFKKYTYGGRESWSLNAISVEELGEGKVDFPPEVTWKDRIENHWNDFVIYNVKDSVLVARLDKKMKFLELAFTIAYKAKVNYEDVYSPVKTWDAIISNELLAEKVVVPQRKSSGSDGSSIEGAYVKDPEIKLHRDVAALDATSLYPSIAILLNLSPETFRGKLDFDVDLCLKGVDPDYLLKNNLCMGANGTLYTREVVGVFPRLLKTFMADRKIAKKEMLSIQQKIESGDHGGDTQDLTNKVAALDNLQMAIKILMNSWYGSLAQAGFRFFDRDFAEAITLTGQLFLRSIERDVNATISSTFKIESGKFLLYMDTDSVYFTLHDIIQKYTPALTGSARIKMMEKIVDDKIQPIVNGICADVSDQLNVMEKSISFKKEICADAAVWLGKKKYFARVWSSEGVTYAKPKMKVLGIEIVRSSTPKIVQDSLRDSLELILDTNESTLQEYNSKVRGVFMQSQVNDIAFPRGVKNLKDYTSSTHAFVKGCPIHVRAALLYNRKLQELGLVGKYRPLNDGDKIKFIYLKEPNPLQQNIIGWPVDGVLPAEFGLEKYIDYDLQFEKAFESVLQSLVTPVGWSLQEKSSLEEFF